jgi:hypothetical protein
LVDLGEGEEGEEGEVLGCVGVGGAEQVLYVRMSGMKGREVGERNWKGRETDEIKVLKGNDEWSGKREKE